MYLSSCHYVGNSRHNCTVLSMQCIIPTCAVQAMFGYDGSGYTITSRTIGNYHLHVEWIRAHLQETYPCSFIEMCVLTIKDMRCNGICAGRCITYTVHCLKHFHKIKTQPTNIKFLQE